MLRRDIGVATRFLRPWVLSFVLISEVEIENAAANLGARALGRNAGKVEGVGAFVQPRTGNEQGECSRRPVVLSGRGDGLGPESLALRIVQVDGVGRVSLLGKIDQNHGALLAIRLHRG